VTEWDKKKFFIQRAGHDGHGPPSGWRMKFGRRCRKRKNERKKGSWTMWQKSQRLPADKLEGGDELEKGKKAEGRRKNTGEQRLRRSSNNLGWEAKREIAKME